MIEVYRNLYVGDQRDYENIKFNPNFFFVQACKEPYHRIALGYKGRAAPRYHPEYLIAYRTNRIILNLIDVEDKNYIPKEIIDAAIDFIFKFHKNDNKILIHCNLGESRAPSVGILYLAINNIIRNHTYQEAYEDFIKIYPNYFPKNGIKQFLIENWSHYINSYKG